MYQRLALQFADFIRNWIIT